MARAITKISQSGWLLNFLNKSLKINAPFKSISYQRGAILNNNVRSRLLQYNQARYFRSSIVLNDKVLVVPQFPESVNDGDVKWIKKVGDQVAVDEEIAEIETDKTAIPVNSPEAGVIAEIYVEDGTTVKSGDQLCKIKSD